MLQATARYSTYAMVATAMASLWLVPATAEANVNVEIKEWQVPWEQSRPRDPWAMPDGTVWFVGQRSHYAAIFDPEAQQFTMYDVPTQYARPYGLVVHNDQPWATLFGSHKLATVRDGELVEIELPRESARPRRLAVTADGMVWYVDYADGYLGRYNPSAEEVSEWRAPSAKDSRPYGMAADSEGRLWFVETGVQPNRLVGFDPATNAFVANVEIPSGGGSIRHMYYDANSNSIWFGTDANTIGQALLSDSD